MWSCALRSFGQTGFHRVRAPRGFRTTADCLPASRRIYSDGLPGNEANTVPPFSETADCMMAGPVRPVLAKGYLVEMACTSISGMNARHYFCLHEIITFTCICVYFIMGGEAGLSSGRLYPQIPWSQTNKGSNFDRKQMTDKRCDRNHRRMLKACRQRC